MRLTSAVLMLLAPSLAAAKPLPTGMAITLVKGQVVVSQSGVSLPLFASRKAVTKLTSAELTDDGKSIAIKSEQCNGQLDDGSEAVLIPVGEIQAKIENALGMQVHVKKQYAEAIKHFALAAQSDPDTEVYATNLLSAQSMSGKLDDADKTIATYGKRNAPWFAWRLAVDPELKALRSRPSAKLGVTTAGTARSSLGSEVAYSPLGLVALEVSINMWDGIPDGSGESELEILDLHGGKRLLRLPTETTCGMDQAALMNGDAHPAQDKACLKRVAPKNAAQRKIADAVMAGLGFTLVAKGTVDLWGGDGTAKTEVTGPDGRKVLLQDDKSKVVAHGKTIEFELPFKTRLVAFVPGAIVLVAKGGKRMESCDAADGPYQMEPTVVATP